MLWENRQSNYDKYPKIKIKEIDELSSEAYEGYADIISKIKATVENLHKEKVVIVLDYYHGVRLTYSPCLKAGDSWIQTILAY